MLRVSRKPLDPRRRGLEGRMGVLRSSSECRRSRRRCGVTRCWVIYRLSNSSTGRAAADKTRGGQSILAALPHSRQPGATRISAKTWRAEIDRGNAARRDQLVARILFPGRRTQHASRSTSSGLAKPSKKSLNAISRRRCTPANFYLEAAPRHCGAGQRPIVEEPISSRCDHRRGKAHRFPARRS